jgi:hypothetical protein
MMQLIALDLMELGSLKQTLLYIMIGLEKRVDKVHLSLGSRYEGVMIRQKSLSDHFIRDYGQKINLREYRTALLNLY